MMIIGCDFHPSWQQIAWLDSETGETGEQKLVHAGGEARQFYQQLAAPVLIGMEATGNSQWFIELVEDWGHEIWIRDAAQIRASYVRKQKTDKRDAAHILKLLLAHVCAFCGSWARSPSKATACCARCWWKRRRTRCDMIPGFAGSICIAVIRNPKPWPRWRRHAN